MDALVEHAQQLTGDPARAEALAEQARKRSEDEVEQRRIVAELVEAQSREAASARVEAWKGLKARSWRVAPVLVAFAVGLMFGGGVGLIRPEPLMLVPNAAPV